jgi:hypothetical protein
LPSSGQKESQRYTKKRQIRKDTEQNKQTKNEERRGGGTNKDCEDKQSTRDSKPEEATPGSSYGFKFSHRWYEVLYLLCRPLKANRCFGRNISYPSSKKYSVA